MRDNSGPGVLIALSLALLFGWPPGATAQEQLADPDYRPVITQPTWPRGGPLVLVDQAHANFHTLDGRYKPFADLLRADGYRMAANTSAFSAAGLRAARVLVVANANFSPDADRSAPVFTAAECDAVRRWVKGGGGLLLIADHAPFGAAAESLGACFGVSMGKGWVFDQGAAPVAFTTQFSFTRENGQLGDHPITSPADPARRVTHVRAFTGQSLGLPKGADALLKLSATAREAPDADALTAAAAAVARGAAPASPSVAGRVQGLAFRHGQGRVVVLGEAALFSAQLVRFPDGRELRMGMNVPGNDNQTFALNVLRWLSQAPDARGRSRR